MGDGFYRSKEPTYSVKVLKEMLQKRKKTKWKCLQTSAVASGKARQNRSISMARNTYLLQNKSCHQPKNEKHTG